MGKVDSEQQHPCRGMIVRANCRMRTAQLPNKVIGKPG